jgi:hypothetical protein
MSHELFQEGSITADHVMIPSRNIAKTTQNDVKNTQI